MIATLPLDTDIIFLIPVPDWQPEEATPLQGFAQSLCFNAGLVRAAALLPSNVVDLSPEGQETFLARRLSGSNPVHWFPQSPRALMVMPVPPFTPFTVALLGKDDDLEQYRAWADSAEVPPIIVAASGGDLTYDKLTPENLQKLFLERCDWIPASVDPEAVREARRAISAWTPVPERSLGYQVGGHGSVAPNLMALMAAGFTNLVYGPFEKINIGPQPYVNQIAQTAHSIFDERARVGHRQMDRTFRRPPDLNLFAPAIYPHFFEAPIPGSMTGPEKRQFRLARNALQRQSGYSFDVRTDMQGQALFGIDRTSVSQGELNFQPHPLLVTRLRELELCTEAVGSLAASEISAVLRLPNAVNRTAGIVRQFAQHYRSATTPNFAKRRVIAFGRVQAQLARAMPPDFYELIRRSQEGIRVISDAHLEWLDVDGLPLAIRKNLSRIPVTPGNLLVAQLGSRGPLRLTPENFREILIISALARDDPIKPFFEVAFEEFGREWGDKINVWSVEVSSADELVAALNKYTGALVIFDGHGSHRDDEPAYLHLMDDRIDVWQLHGRLDRPPPIVVLSACDTHAADRNHATVANGFLSLGTRAVLGSVFPLDAREAAVFAARLVYRVFAFVPAAAGLFGHSLTWTEIVSGLLRMQLLTDLLRALETKNIITHDVYVDVHQHGNMAINGGHEDPFVEVSRLLQSAGVESHVIRRELEVAVVTSSVISYLNIGRPETILVDTKERYERDMQELSGVIREDERSG